MEQQRNAKKQKQERRRNVAIVHSTSLSIQSNTRINQNIQITQNLQPQIRIDRQTSPFPQTVQRRYPYLKEIIDNSVRNPRGRRWTFGLLMLSALIYFYSPSAYSIFKEQIPLPAISTVYKGSSSEILDNSELLLEASKLP